MAGRYGLGWNWSNGGSRFINLKLVNHLAGKIFKVTSGFIGVAVDIKSNKECAKVSGLIGCINIGPDIITPGSSSIRISRWQTSILVSQTVSS